MIRGIIPPLPPLARQPRALRMMNPGSIGPFDPAFRQYPTQQPLQTYPQPHSAIEPTQQAGIASSNEQAETADTAAILAEKPVLPPSVPAKPAAASPSTMNRSASQPGVQRVYTNGITSRSESPAPSNISSHGNGHPRRAGSRAPVPTGSANGPSADRCSSSIGANGTRLVPQRVPGADAFPALGGTAFPHCDKKESPVANGKTAAEVLSLPAPPKPVAVATIGVDGDHDDNHVSLVETLIIIISR